MPASPARVNALVARVFFVVAAIACVAAFFVLVLRPGRGGLENYGVTMSVPVVFALAIAWAVLMAQRGRLAPGIALVLAGGVATVAAVAVTTGVGLHALTFGFYALIVVCAGVLLSSLAAMVFGVLCAATLVAMYWAEVSGLLPGVAAVASVPLQSRLLTSLLMVAVSMLLAALLARQLMGALRESVHQEHRFRSLLSIASDWYWEQDAELRFTSVSPQIEQMAGIAVGEAIGKTRWGMPGAVADSADWDAHRADLAARRPFRDFRFARVRPSGETVWFSVSGEPTFDAKGGFTGYWGVAHDITAQVQAESAQRASDSRFRELFLLSPSPFILHRHGLGVMANRAAAALFGFDDPGEVEGFEIALMTAPEDRGLSRERIAALENAAVGVAVPTRELRMRKRDGTPLIVEARVVRVALADGPASLSIYYDLTERRRGEAELQRSRAMLSQLFQATPDYITVSDIDTGRLEMVNDGFERLTGFSAAEAVGRTSFELGLWAQPEQRVDLIEAVRRTGVARDVPALLRRRDGELRKVLFGAASFALEGRTWMVAIARDITAAEQQRLQYDAMLGSAAVGVAYTRARIFERANQAFERMFGWAPGELIGEPGSVVWPSDADYAAMGEAVGPALARGEAIDVERTMRRRDGSTFLCRLQGRVVDPRSPHSSGTIWIAEDVTVRRAEQQRLAHSELLLSLVVEANPDYVTVSELDSGRLVIVNDGFTQMTGFTKAEAVGRTIYELGVWQDAADRQRFAAQLREHGAVRSYPARLRACDGRAISGLVSAATFLSDGVLHVTATVRDVTDSERARLEYEAIFGNASIGIAFTRDRVFQHVNPRFEEMYGWPAGTLAGQPGAVVWLSGEDYADVGRTAGPVLARGEPIELERRMRRRDGSEFWCRLLGRAVDPTHPSRGGTIWIAEDITDSRATREALAEAKTAAEAASRAKSAFLANTSHEIRTPLNGLLGLARLANDAKISAVQRANYLKGIVESAEQLSGLISDILDLSKIEAGKLTLEAVTFDLHAVLANLAAGYRELASEKGLNCTLSMAPGVPRFVSGDPLRVRQIVSNFLANALKFTERGGMRVHAEPVRYGWVRISVSDTGIGIAPEAHARLFTRFMQADESTTRRFGGTGLGLSICKELALLMQGDVGVDSTPGRGSRFWVDLLLPEAPPPQDEAGPAVSLAGVRVLLVEDNPVNMLIAASMVESWGVQVVQATDGEQAVARVHEVQHDPAARFDLVLMDVHMPVMNGHDATVELRRSFAADALPIVALTAAALASEQEMSLAIGMNDFITKPVDAEKLRAVVTRWTRGRSSARQVPAR
jgi:PAS domain S-box-containing protein